VLRGTGGYRTEIVLRLIASRRRFALAEDAAPFLWLAPAAWHPAERRTIGAGYRRWAAPEPDDRAGLGGCAHESPLAVNPQHL